MWALFYCLYKLRAVQQGWAAFIVSAIRVTGLSPLEGYIFVYIIYLNVHKIKPIRILLFLDIGIIIIDRRKVEVL